MSKRIIKATLPIDDIIGWDIGSWKHALDVFEKHISAHDGGTVLDIGARDGGLSLYYALKGFNVICSDISGPLDDALSLHQKYGVQKMIKYLSVDATAIDFPDNRFDIVSFKSVLGGIGRLDSYDRQQQAIAEMYRVLKPGGMMLFAENLVGSALHQYARRKFVRWGKSWRYLSFDEIKELLLPFREIDLKPYGCVAAFGRSEKQRRMLHAVDIILNPLLPADFKYIVFGCAKK